MSLGGHGAVASRPELSSSAGPRGAQNARGSEASITINELSTGLPMVYFSRTARVDPPPANLRTHLQIQLN